MLSPQTWDTAVILNVSSVARINHDKCKKNTNIVLLSS